VNKSGKVWGSGVTEKVVWSVVRECAAKAGIVKLAPHDLCRYAEVGIVAAVWAWAATTIQIARSDERIAILFMTFLLPELGESGTGRKRDTIFPIFREQGSRLRLTF
jgi:hypothetical protein